MFIKKYYDPELDDKVSRKSGLFRMAHTYKSHVYYEEWARFYKEKIVTVRKYERNKNIVYSVELLQKNPISLNIQTANSTEELTRIMLSIGYKY